MIEKSDTVFDEDSNKIQASLNTKIIHLNGTADIYDAPANLVCIQSLPLKAAGVYRVYGIIEMRQNRNNG